MLEWFFTLIEFIQIRSDLGALPKDKLLVLKDFKNKIVIVTFLTILDKRYGFLILNNTKVVKFRGL